jgi:AmiR/NasT family two-component response regulator
MDEPSALTNGDLALAAEIHQAAGILTVQLGVPITEALARLRAHALTTRRALIDVARDVIAHRLHLPAVTESD